MRDHVRLGYAATEPGNQADTQTASITLATPATTGRGLYVAMTRGRDENLVRVITDTHDPAEARDILEGIIATDRTDTPATTHRRNLTTITPPTPALQPRCAIPGWFAELHTAAVTAFESARDDHTRAVAEHEELATAMVFATRRLEAANRACDPFDEQLGAARTALTDATHRRQAAERRFDTSGLVGRRHVRHDLANAVVAEADARAEYQSIAADSRPTQTERDTARQDLTELRQRNRDDQLMNQWRYLPERAADTRSHLDALDTWQQWAEGQPVTTDRLRAALATLDNTNRVSATQRAEIDALIQALSDHNGPATERGDHARVARSRAVPGLGR